MSYSILTTGLSFLCQGKATLAIIIFSLATISSSFIITDPMKHDGTLPYPVIGILTQPSAFSVFGYSPSDYSYIAASYVKHLEAAGATIVPIQWDLPYDQIDTLLTKVNGVLLPGGGSTLINKASQTPSKFTKAGMHIIERAIQFNTIGDYFPIWGTCLGYELLVLAISKNMSLLIDVVDGDDSAKMLNLTQDGLNGMYAFMEPRMLNEIETQGISYFHHKHAPDPNAFISDANLASNFTVAAWTYDSLAGQYAASIQGTTYPFMGTQFHPEKNTFEWFSNTTVPHHLEAIMAQQYHAFYFVNETLKSTHQFNSEDDLAKSWIYNYKPKHFGPDPQFEEVYLFKNYKAYDVHEKLVSEYPIGCEPHNRESELAQETQGKEEAFMFKEAAPFLFTK